MGPVPADLPVLVPAARPSREARELALGLPSVALVLGEDPTRAKTRALENGLHSSGHVVGGSGGPLPSRKT